MSLLVIPRSTSAFALVNGWRSVRLRISCDRRRNPTGLCDKGIHCRAARSGVSAPGHPRVTDRTYSSGHPPALRGRALPTEAQATVREGCTVAVCRAGRQRSSRRLSWLDMVGRVR